MMCNSKKCQLSDLMPYVVTRAYSCLLVSTFRPDKKTIARYHYLSDFSINYACKNDVNNRTKKEKRLKVLL